MQGEQWVSTAIPVVICDDSQVARKQMARALEGWGVDITFAKHGLEALEAIRTGKGELLFLDLNMPVMDGYETLSRIRKDDLPAMTIVVSGDVQAEAYERVMALGALAFIEKPTSKEVLSDVLTRFGLVAGTAHQNAVTEEHLQLPDYYQEIANVAMGRAGSLLARVLDVFVKLPIPDVRFISKDELDLHLHHAAEQRVRTVSQGFIGHDIAGEALLMFRESNYRALARLLGTTYRDDKASHSALLMEVSNTLTGAFLTSFEKQLDVTFGRASPVIIDGFDGISQAEDLWQKALSINICYSISDYNIECDLMLVFTEDSIPKLHEMTRYF